MSKTIDRRRTPLTKREIVDLVFLLEPEVWGVNAALIELGRKFLSQGKQFSIPIYLVGWPDGTRAVVRSPHPPGSEGWRRGLPQAYRSAIRQIGVAAVGSVR